MEPQERHSTLMLDEIQLTPGLVFDNASGTLLGARTLPLADGSLPSGSLATHALVFMLGGVSSRWKQTVAYHLTGNFFHAKSVKDFITQIIRDSEKSGLTIDVVVSDMGGGNQALWKLFGIVAGRYSQTKTWYPHPCDAVRKLYFMPDVPHLLKNLRNHLTRGQIIHLPARVVEKHQLPCCEVQIDPIKRLVDLDSQAELKLAPHLKPSCIEPGHFDKMKVGLAFSLLNNDTGAALRILVSNGRIEQKALSAAWFVETLFKWVKLMSSRTTKLAFSHFDDTKHEDNITFFKRRNRAFYSHRHCGWNEKRLKAHPNWHCPSSKSSITNSGPVPKRTRLSLPPHQSFQSRRVGESLLETSRETS